APLAGAETGLLRGGGARVEAHVAGLGRHGGAAGPAVDAGGDHPDEEPPVEPGVLRLDGPHAPFPVLVHVSSITDAHLGPLAEIRHQPSAWVSRGRADATTCWPGRTSHAGGEHRRARAHLPGELPVRVSAHPPPPADAHRART